MKKLAITNIDLNQHPFIRDVSISIPVNEDESALPPIIITGKNGSGKTTLLNNIHRFTQSAINNHRSFEKEQNRISHFKREREKPNLTEDQRINAEETFAKLQDQRLNNYGHAQVGYNLSYSALNSNPSKQYILAQFIAHRTTSIAKVTAISQPKVDDTSRTSKGEQFLQYLVNRKSQQAFAVTDGKQDEANEIAQ